MHITNEYTVVQSYLEVYDYYMKLWIRLNDTVLGMSSKRSFPCKCFSAYTWVLNITVLPGHVLFENLSWGQYRITLVTLDLTLARTPQLMSAQVGLVEKSAIAHATCKWSGFGMGIHMPNITAVIIKWLIADHTSISGSIRVVHSALVTSHATCCLEYLPTLTTDRRVVHLAMSLLAVDLEECFRREFIMTLWAKEICLTVSHHVSSEVTWYPRLICAHVAMDVCFGRYLYFRWLDFHIRIADIQNRPFCGLDYQIRIATIHNRPFCGLNFHLKESFTIEFGAWQSNGTTYISYCTTYDNKQFELHHIQYCSHLYI